MTDEALPSQAELNEFVQRVYAEQAADYDRQLLVDCEYRTPELVAEWVSRALALAASDPRPPTEWLELGAGTGLVGAALERRGIVLDLAAVDLSLDMMDRISSPLYRSRIVADVTRPLPVLPRSCSGAIAASLLEHVGDPGSFLAQVASALRSGGFLVMTYRKNRLGASVMAEPLAAHISHDESQMATALDLSGFEVLGACDFEGYRSGREGWVASQIVLARLKFRT